MSLTNSKLWILNYDQITDSENQMVTTFVRSGYSEAQKRSELYFWQREEKGTQAEVDYITVNNGKIIPEEVKAGKRGSLQSMYIFLEKKGLTTGIRCALEPFSSYNDILVYPLYAVSGFAQNK